MDTIPSPLIDSEPIISLARQIDLHKTGQAILRYYFTIYTLLLYHLL